MTLRNVKNVKDYQNFCFYITSLNLLTGSPFIINKMATNKEEEIEFDWVKLHEDMEKVITTETGIQKLIRKSQENPLVPIGALATVGALGYGLWCFKQGQTRKSQYMMRARVAAQGFTIVAMLAGMIITARKNAGIK